MPINDVRFETVNVRIQPHADVDGIVNLFLRAIRGSGGSSRRVDLTRFRNEVATFHVEVDGENDTIGPLLEQWTADNADAVVEIW